MFKILLALFIFLAHLRSQAQDLPLENSRLGLKAGLVLALGTHVQRAGLSFNFYYLVSRVQFNSQLRLSYDFRSLGPPQGHWELLLSQGIVYGYGKKRWYSNPFIGSVSNQTQRGNSLGYSFNAYFNKIHTSQQTGIIAIQLGDFSLLAENDILAKPALDRFRTGAFLLQYQYLDLVQAGLNSTLWTGKMGDKSGILNPHFHYQCYMDTTRSVYANYSHGLLSAQLKCALPYGQTLQASTGIDAEQVRNLIQNEIIHDLSFLPKKWNKARNCHIPMLDREGRQFLYGEGQRIRPARAYANLYFNPAEFY